MDYARGRAILVDVFQRLFNGQSVFGVDGSADRAAAVPAPGTIIIDDTHACLGKAEHAFRLTIPRDDPVYDTLLALFQDACLTRAYAPGGTSKKRHEMRACMSCRRRATHTTSYHGVRDSEQCSLKQQAVEVGRVWFSLCPDTGGMS
jgi:hypothetical protein